MFVDHILSVDVVLADGTTPRDLGAGGRFVPLSLASLRFLAVKGAVDHHLCRRTMVCAALEIWEALRGGDTGGVA